MTVAVQDQKPPVVRTKVAPGLTHRRASDYEQSQWTSAQKAANTCMHCKTAYKTGSGAAHVCEHWHEGL